MCDIRSAPSVVVGIDGSRAATDAAVWAVDEAVSRDIPLRLVYVIDPGDLCGAESDHTRFAAAAAALYDAHRAVDATEKPVKIETETLVDKPAAKLAAESRSAVMLCIGSMGTKRECHGGGSVASALPLVAQSPVAVIHRPRRREAVRKLGSVVVEVDNGVVLRHAFDEARLRGAPLRVIASWRAEVPEDIVEEHRLARARLNRQLAGWKRLYPDVKAEPIAVFGDVCQYLTDNIDTVQLFVVGAQRSRCDSDSLRRLGCSVLTVGRNHL